MRGRFRRLRSCRARAAPPLGGACAPDYRRMSPQHTGKPTANRHQTRGISSSALRAINLTSSAAAQSTSPPAARRVVKTAAVELTARENVLPVAGRFTCLLFSREAGMYLTVQPKLRNVDGVGATTDRKTVADFTYSR